MKLTKLYTLSQFVDFITYEVADTTSAKMEAVIQYNEILKQKSEIGMFINPYEKPLHIFSDDPNPDKSKMYQNNPKVKEWQEAQSKVIFKGWEATDEFYLTYKNQTSIDIDDVEFWLESMDFGEYINQEINTLHDLAEATGGELEIDVEI